MFNKKKIATGLQLIGLLAFIGMALACDSGSSVGTYNYDPATQGYTPTVNPDSIDNQPLFALQN